VVAHYPASGAGRTSPKTRSKKTWSVSCSQQGSRCFPGSPLLPHRRLPTCTSALALLKSTELDVLRLVSAGHGEAGRHAGVGENVPLPRHGPLGLSGVSSSRLLSQLRSDIKDLVDTPHQRLDPGEREEVAACVSLMRGTPRTEPRAVSQFNGASARGSAAFTWSERHAVSHKSGVRRLSSGEP